MTRHGGVFAALAAAAGLACAPPTAPVREIDKAETAVKSAERENKTQEAAGLQTTMARERRERAAEAELTAESLRAEIADLQAKETARGLVITLNTDLLFDVDRSELKPGAMSGIERIADALNGAPGRRVRIEGHGDSTGSEAHNLDLSKRRADAVAAALIADGVLASRITSQGFGDSMPVASNGTQAGRQQNRRVEIIVQPPHG